MPTLSNRYVMLAANFTVRGNSHASIETYVICLSSVEEDIPQTIFELDGAAEQLSAYRKSDVAAEIIAIAARFQDTASDNRLGTQNANLEKAALSRFKKPAPGLSKGKTLMAEMKAAAKGEAGRIKITAGLYLLSKYKRGGAEVMKRVM
jgi:hypothetical protein